MGIIDSKLKNVGTTAAQLSSDLSFTEKTSIKAIKDIGGLSSAAGKINSDVSAAVSKLTQTQKASMDLGSEMARKLESKGVFGKSAGKLVRGTLNKAVLNKSNISKSIPKLPTNLGDISNRIPGGKFGAASATKKIKNTKETILGRADLRFGGTTYPPDLTQEAAAYLKLQFFEYMRPNAFEKGTMNDVEYVELPLPDNLSVAHGVKYAEKDTGFLGDFMNSQAAGSAIAAARSADGYGSGMMAAGKDLISNINVDASAVGGVAFRAGYAGLEQAGQIPGIDLSSVAGVAGQLAGAIPNPHPSIFFQGLELRTFQWTWKFVPRSPEEAEILQKMLKRIREWILPEQQSSFLKYPRMVQPQVMGDNVEMYGKFKKAMVSQFSINYMGEGTSAFYIDGSPVSVIVAMNFQEVENFTRGDV